MAADEKKNVHAGHRDRMRERFLAGGLGHFEPHEVLELLLFEFIPVVNTNPIGHALIERFGDVKSVLTASYDELVKVRGIGPKTAEGILTVYPVLSADICEWFRRSGALTRTDIAFLADWFMDRTPFGSVGMIVCGHDRRFHDFIRLQVYTNDPLSDLANQVAEYAGRRAYYLLIKEDFNLLPKEKADVLRRFTGTSHAYMIDAYVLERHRPTSVFYL